MTDVRAGVAYVDVRLGAIEDFKKDLKSKVETAFDEVGKRVGDELAKSATPSMTKAGTTTSKAMSKAFFADAKSSFMGGMRALSDFNIKTFGQMMLQSGAAGAMGLKTGLEAGIKGFMPTTTNLLKKGFSVIASAATAAGTTIANKLLSGIKAIPGMLTAASAAVSSFSRRIGLLGFQMTNFGFIATTAFTAPVAAILTLGTAIGINTAVKIEQATAALKALTPAGTNVEALVKRLQALAQKSPIFQTADVVDFTQKMVASGLTVKQTEKFLASFGNIALTVGADVSKIPLALEALVQMVSKGKVSMEELRLQLGDALPGAMKIVADSLGVTTGELYKMVEAGDLTGTELVKALTKFGQTKRFLDGAGTGVDTLGAKWQTLKETVSNQLGQIFLDNSSQIKQALDELGPSLSNLINISKPVFLDLIKGFKGFVDGIANAIKWYQNLTPENQKLFKTLSLIAIALGPVAILFGALGSAIAGIAALISFIISPVGLVIAGIIALGVGITVLVKYLKNAYAEGGKFKEIWDTVWASVMKLVKNLMPVINDLWNDLKDAWAQLSKVFSDNKDELLTLVKIVGAVIGVIAALVGGVLFGAIKGIIAALGPIIKAIASLVSGVIKLLSGIIDFIVGVFTGDWSRAWLGIQKIWDGIWDAIVGTLTNLVQAIWNLVKGLVTGIGDFFYWLWNLLVGHSIVPDMVNAIISWFRKLVDMGKSIVSALGAFFSAFYGRYIAPFVNAFVTGINKVISTVTGLASRVKSALSSAGSWLVQTGRDIINGLVNGVKSMGNTLKNAILNLIPGPVRGIVESALGINSPSKVFKQIGQYVVQGFIDGISSMNPKMMTEMDKLSNIIPGTPSFATGDKRNPVIGKDGPKAALNIENYYANDDADPRRQAEDWYFLVSARGGNV